MTISIPSDSYFQQTFDFYLGSGVSSYKNDIWQRYLLTREYIDSEGHVLKALPSMEVNHSGQVVSTLSDEERTALQEDFRQFLTFYTGMGIESDALTLYQGIPLPADDFYNTYLRAFYGDLPAIVKQDIWNQFLVTRHYESTPPDTNEVREAFASFIQQKRAKAYSFESQLSLSPLEIQKRFIFTQILDALSKYLQATQTLVTIQSALLIFYGKWQQEYTQAMTQVPTLKKGMPGLVNAGTLHADGTADVNSPSSFTFGYSNISLQDIIRWGYSKALAAPGTWATYGEDTHAPGSYSFKVTESGETKQLEIKFKRNTSSYDSINWDYTKTITIPDKTATPAVTSDFASVVEAAGRKFTEIFETDIGKVPFVTAMEKLYVPDVASWAFQRMQESPNAVITFGNKSDSSVPPASQFQLYFLSKTFKIGETTFHALYAGTSEDAVTAEGATYIAITEMHPTYMTLLQNKIVELLGGASNIPKIGTIGLPGYYLGTEGKGLTATLKDSNNQDYTKNYGLDLDQGDLAARGERQAVLSQYSDNLRSLRTKVGNLASQYQTALTQSKDSINQQSDMWTSILDTIQSIMTAILKRS